MTANIRLAHDYFKVRFQPGDLPDPGERARLAIIEAEERSRNWVVPCIWEVIADDGSTVTVRRTRPAHFRKHLHSPGGAPSRS